MGNLLKRGVVSVLGMAAVLAYWSFRGGSSGESMDKIPAKVWAGGGQLSIDVETTCPARMSVTFGERDKEDGKSLEAWQKIPAGRHSWTIDVPPRVGGYIDLTAEEPKVGDRLSWTIRANGRVVDQQSETLEQPLRDGYAFGVQVYVEDYLSGQIGDD
jgi:hypothetical protein